jgi:regulator of nucleoside diphosphate kinase
VKRSTNPKTVTEADFANLSLLGPHAPLQRVLEQAIVVSSDAIPPQVVTMNTQVILSNETTGERRLVCVVYPADAHPTAGRVSVLDGLGTALLGASPGDTIECDSSGGANRLRVEEVLHQPEHSLRTRLVVRGADDTI